MQNNKKTINVIHYTRIPTAATKVQGKKIMSFFRTDNAWYNICCIYRIQFVISTSEKFFLKDMTYSSRENSLVSGLK